MSKSEKNGTSTEPVKITVEFKYSWMGKLFRKFGWKPWMLEFQDSHIRIVHRRRAREFRYDNIDRLYSRREHGTEELVLSLRNGKEFYFNLPSDVSDGMTTDEITVAFENARQAFMDAQNQPRNGLEDKLDGLLEVRGEVVGLQKEKADLEQSLGKLRSKIVALENSHGKELAELRREHQEQMLEAIPFLVEGIQLPQHPYQRNEYTSNHKFKVWADSITSHKDRSRLELARKFLDQVSEADAAIGESILEKFPVLNLWLKYLRAIEGGDGFREKCNKDFVSKELERRKGFFDTIEKALTNEQRRAAVVMEDRNLLVASAGSGKTSALVGKVAYAIESGFCKPDEILAIAFNRNAADEMRQRLDALPDGLARAVRTSTFHEFGMDVIGQARGSKPSVPDWVAKDMGSKNREESIASDKKWKQIVDDLIEEDEAFANDYWKMVLCYRDEMKPQHEFESKKDYERYLESVKVKTRGGDHPRVLTLNGEWVRSMQEMAIANWLYLHKVDYRYEVPYEVDTSDAEHGQYTPDFYYPAAGPNAAGVYHEHFAFDADRNPPSYFSGDYVKDAEWKLKQHCKNNTQLIETTSAMFTSGKIFTHLRSELRKYGIDYSKPRLSNEVQAKLQEHTITPIYRLMQQFLTHWKSSGLEFDQLEKKALGLDGYTKLRCQLFLRIISRVKEVYEKELEAQDGIDFEDMLQKAVKCLEAKSPEDGSFCHPHPYKLVVVDEFQDVSRSRARLVKSMLEQKPDCVLFAVGDDWQSIYRFAGSDVNIMIAFEKEFGTTSINYLRKTFRSNKGITDIATKFVMRNSDQIRKVVRAENNANHSVVSVIHYHKPESSEKFIGLKLEEISRGKEGAARNERISVLILGRYNKDRPDALDKWKGQFAGKLDIDFLTVHKAKGTEANYVFVLGLQTGSYGFPNDIGDDPLLKLAQPEAEAYPRAEERRLLYVALTRAKRKVWLMSNYVRCSPFVEEVLFLKSQHRRVIEECYIGEDGEVHAGGFPDSLRCQDCEGNLVPRTGKYGDFWGCSNFQCKFTWKDRRMAERV